jgi:protein-L-isoaspartate(D-aspartate) O-methyltransferase
MMDEAGFFYRERERMILDQIVHRGIRDRRVVDALWRVPRHLFVDPALQEQAYADRPLPTGGGQTISQPFIVALMTSLLRLRGDETVLEIGTGSGYQAAVLSRLAGWVHTIEYLPDLAESAASRLANLGFVNISVHPGDGTLGFVEAAPYQGILVTAAAPEPPGPLLSQVADGGRMVIPIGGPSEQELQVWRREGHSFAIRHAGPVAFVPLRGEYGWSKEDWK